MTGTKQSEKMVEKLAEYFSERGDKLSLDCLAFSLARPVYIADSEMMKKRWAFFKKCIEFGEVILYGAGNEGRVTYKELCKRGVKVLAFIDSVKKGRIFGIPIITIEEYKKNYSDITIIITPAFHKEEVRTILEKNGVSKYFSYFDNTVLLDNTNNCYIPEAARLYKKSGSTYFCLTQFTSLDDKEVFVDCGAYTGDTVEGFISLMGGGGMNIYMPLNPTPKIIQSVWKISRGYVI